MSDDRMDRAARIRNMREGNRGTDEETAATDEEAAGSGSSRADSAAASSASDGDRATSSSAADSDSGAEPSQSARTADQSSASPAGRADTADSGTSPSTGTTPSTPTDAQPTETAGRSDQSTGAGGTAQPTDSVSQSDTASATATSEAEAAAQRAAASAEEVMGASGTQTDAAVDPAAEAAADEAPASPESAPAGSGGAGGIPGDVTGVELPDQQLLEEAMANSSVTSTEGGARAAAVEGETTQSEEIVRVLEFALGDEYYCLDIEYVEEIVKRNAVTRVPNTPDFVDGVVDLRGQITTILEPKSMMDIDNEGDQNLIIVFDPDQFEEQGAVGWVVDEVRQVVPVTESEVNRPPVDAEYINGVVDREEYDQFVIWIEPEDALTQATATDEE